MPIQKTEAEIEEVLSNLPGEGETQYPAMTYEQGITEALQWVLGELSDEDFEYIKIPER